MVLRYVRRQLQSPRSRGRQSQLVLGHYWGSSDLRLVLLLLVQESLQDRLNCSCRIDSLVDEGMFIKRDFARCTLATYGLHVHLRSKRNVSDTLIWGYLISITTVDAVGVEVQTPGTTNRQVLHIPRFGLVQVPSSTALCETGQSRAKQLRSKYILFRKKLTSDTRALLLGMFKLSPIRLSFSFMLFHDSPVILSHPDPPRELPIPEGDPLRALQDVSCAIQTVRCRACSSQAFTPCDG